MRKIKNDIKVLGSSSRIHGNIHHQNEEDKEGEKYKVENQELCSRHDILKKYIIIAKGLVGGQLYI
jgi:hypothetical protein